MISMFTAVRSFASIVIALTCLKPAHAQFLVVSAKIESTSWPVNSSGDRTEHQRTYTTKCISGTNQWCIEDDGPLNAKESWWCTGTNIVQRTIITKEAPEHTEPGLRGTLMPGPPFHVGDSFAKTYRMSERQPLTGIPNLVWLALCSGSFLKVEGRCLLPPFPTQASSQVTTDKTETFGDALGLPKRVEIYSPQNQLICVYEVQQSTNFSGLNVPLQFEFSQFEAKGSNDTERIYHALGTVLSLRLESELRVPSDLRKNSEPNE